MREVKTAIENALARHHRHAGGEKSLGFAIRISRAPSARCSTACRRGCNRVRMSSHSSQLDRPTDLVIPIAVSSVNGSPGVSPPRCRRHLSRRYRMSSLGFLWTMVIRLRLWLSIPLSLAW